MLKPTLVRLAIVGAAAATMFVTTTGSALADTDKTIYLPDGRGYMKFVDEEMSSSSATPERTATASRGH